MPGKRHKRTQLQHLPRPGRRDQEPKELHEEQRWKLLYRQMSGLEVGKTLINENSEEKLEALNNQLSRAPCSKGTKSSYSDLGELALATLIVSHGGWGGQKTGPKCIDKKKIS